MKINDNLPKKMIPLLNDIESKLVTCSSTKILEIGEGYAQVTLEINEQTLNPHGFLHGGVIFTLCDNCAGLTASTLDKFTVTLSSNINYLRKAEGNHIIATPKLIHDGNSTVVISITIEDSFKNIIATSIFTMYVVGTITDNIVLK